MNRDILFVYAERLDEIRFAAKCGKAVRLGLTQSDMPHFGIYYLPHSRSVDGNAVEAFKWAAARPMKGRRALLKLSNANLGRYYLKNRLQAR